MSIPTKPVALCAHREPTPANFIPHALPSTTAKAELRIRQTTSAVGSNTCGWIAGDPISSVTCPSGYGCGAISTYVGCTPNAVYTTCYDRLGPTCDQACQNVLANLYCGNDYCAQFNYPSGSIGYGCATISGYTNTVLLTTTTGSTSSLSGVGVTAPTTVTVPPSNSSTAAASSSSSKNSLSAGAIAGIVIGSVATIAFICGLIFMIYAHRKKNRSPRDAVSRESAMSLNPSTYAPSSQEQRHPHHLSGTTYYDNPSPPFNAGDGPWGTRNPHNSAGELEAEMVHEKDATQSINPRYSSRYSELSGTT